MERIHDKLDEISKDITEIKVTMAVNTEQLAEHMKRSEANEKAVEILKTEIVATKINLSNLNLIVKIFAAVVTSGSVITALIKALF